MQIMESVQLLRRVAPRGEVAEAFLQGLPADAAFQIAEVCVGQHAFGCVKPDPAFNSYDKLRASIARKYQVRSRNSKSRGRKRSHSKIPAWGIVNKIEFSMK